MDMQFERSALELSSLFFGKLYNEKENVLISAVSVASALAMAANGAEGETKMELSKLLLSGMTIEEYNALSEAYFDSLPTDGESKLAVANSMWFPDFLKVKNEFVEKNQKALKAEIHQLPFDEKAASEINRWVKEKTDGMIESVLDAAEPEALMLLINALAFDAKWDEAFLSTNVTDTKFTNVDGSVSTVKGMKGSANRIISYEDCCGFIKNYKNDRFSFMALLPDKDKGISEFVENLSKEKILTVFASGKEEEADVILPKFKTSYGKELNSVLMDLGVKKAFTSEAEFGGISDTPSCIGDVIHKTFIEVDEEGTRAGAVTAVMMKALALPVERKKIVLDRPFVYAIMDNQKGVPLFLGAVNLLPDADDELSFAGMSTSEELGQKGEDAKKLPWWKRIFHQKG